MITYHYDVSVVVNNKSELNAEKIRSEIQSNLESLHNWGVKEARIRFICVESEPKLSEAK